MNEATSLLSDVSHRHWLLTIIVLHLLSLGFGNLKKFSNFVNLLKLPILICKKKLNGM